MDLSGSIGLAGLNQAGSVADVDGARSDGRPPLDLWTPGQLAERILLIWLLLTPVLVCIMEMGSFWLQSWMMVLRVASESAGGMVVAEVEEYSSSADVASPQ